MPSQKLDGQELEQKVLHALRKVMTVRKIAPDLWRVCSESGETYGVSLENRRCFCPYFQSNTDDNGNIPDDVPNCCHIRRVKLECRLGGSPTPMLNEEDMGFTMSSRPDAATDGLPEIDADQSETTLSSNSSYQTLREKLGSRSSGS